MPRLMLLRHAKSDRPAGVEDHDRPLNGRGRAAARKIGAYLADHDLLPDLILCSTSARTRETYHRLGVANPPRVEFDERLYLAEADAILALVRALPRGARNVLLIGHNPGLQDAAIALVATGDAHLRRQLHEKFPTAALAVIDFDSDWPSVRHRSGRLERFVTPKSADAD
ncbi:MAG TPA: histidine phosphatase family protein [Xanthobacteraceae bacterium]|nr:histidine phosphatase family protein [Xanthobacteraceae bacterium]